MEVMIDGERCAEEGDVIQDQQTVDTCVHHITFYFVKHKKNIGMFDDGI
jgi:hypothetical protein